MTDGCGTVSGYRREITLPRSLDERLIRMWLARESRISWVRDECDGYSYALIKPESSR